GRNEDDERLFPNVGQTIPVSWRRVWAMVAALHEGGDPAEAVQSYGKPVKPVGGYAKHNFVTKEFALKTWSTVVRQLHLEAEVEGQKDTRFALKTLRTLKKVFKPCGSFGRTVTAGESSRDEERVLVDALNMRQMGGTLLFACDLVHLDPSWINLLLRELLDHRLAEVEQTEQWQSDVDEYCHKY
ncbi:unnamed protein product, partial [Sphacelaria rigidula]